MYPNTAGGIFVIVPWLELIVVDAEDDRVSDEEEAVGPEVVIANPGITDAVVRVL